MWTRRNRRKRRWAVARRRASRSTVRAAHEASRQEKRESLATAFPARHGSTVL